MRLPKPLTSILMSIAIAGSISCRPPEVPSEPGFRVRLVTSVTISGRWEREAERGLGLIAAELDADIARTRAVGAADQRRALRRHAEEGIDLVFCVGPEAETLVYTEAVAFPDTDFVIIPGSVHGANIGSMAFMPEEVGYLAGAVAASAGEAEAVGLLRGSGRPWLEHLETGFAAGSSKTRPRIEIVTASGPDGPWDLVEAGAEIALYSTDRVEPRVLAAAHDAGLLLIAADPALMAAESEIVIASVDVDVADAMLRIAREVHDHRFIGQVFAFDLGSGVLDVVLNPELVDDEHTAGLRESLERARSEITAGWVEIEELGLD
ncbi:MAG: BMP family ABC transporter substrate-binding protein [Thermoanaerobaculales bacterium]|jgi:basic membrane lipoprotein Med (substrate-binding protein (PBP1-ABC) superfamily)|nr:BMP family ABC transporter substrate-binding protein [Thermoanaerobaculales bacterium]